MNVSQTPPLSLPDISDPLPDVQPGFYAGATYRPENSVGFLMRQVVDLLSRALDTRMSAYGLTDAQWRPLLAMSYGHDNTATQIARMVGCDNGATTRLIDRLEDKGLVQRTRSAQDRRAVQLELTPEGERAARVVPYVIADVLNGFLADLTAHDINQLEDLLRRILQRAQVESTLTQDKEKR